MSARSVMIMVAPNGARRTKRDHPSVPLSASEIAAEAVACTRAGAAALHLHVRNNDDRHTINPDAYQIVLDQIRAVVGQDLIVQITSEAAGVYSPQEQMDMVTRVRPEAVSLAMAEIFPAGGDEGRVREFLLWLKAETIAPQFLVFSDRELQDFLDLKARGVVPFAEPFVLFVLGHYVGRPEARPDDLMPFLDVLGKEDFPWSMCAFGRNESACVKAAIEAGGHVRVGFENNLHRPDGTRFDTNCEVVRNAAATVTSLGCEVMTVPEARDFLARTMA